jgi:uncharacterized protein (UPF0333 family)
LQRAAAVNRVSVIGLTLIVVAAGGMGVYFYTSAANPGGSISTTTVPNGQIRVISNQASNGYLTVAFNGTNYQVAAKGSNAPSFACPVGSDPSLCAVLAATCGNGVGSSQEPWKNCANCAFDAGCTGQQSCDPYTHQCSVLVGACQVAVYGGQ